MIAAITGGEKWENDDDEKMIAALVGGEKWENDDDEKNDDRLGLSSLGLSLVIIHEKGGHQS